MPQPGMNGMEPVFGEAYGNHRALLSPYPLAVSPLGGRTEYDQSVVLMLGSPATPRKRPFELLSDLVDDGGFGEDLHPERWDVSALDDITRYTKLGLGGELASAEDAVLMGRWGRSREEEEEEEEEVERWRRKELALPAPPQAQPPQGGATRLSPCHGQAVSQGSPSLDPSSAPGKAPTVLPPLAKHTDAGGGGGGVEQGMTKVRTVEVYQVAQEEEEAAAAAALGVVVVATAGSVLEHNYSLSQGEERPSGSSPDSDLQTEEEEEEEEEEEGEGEVVREGLSGDVENRERNIDLEEEDEEEEDEEEENDEGEEGAEETTVEAELSSSSETECDAEPELKKPSGERPKKRRCFWEYRHARESKKKTGGEVRWSLSWSSSTLPSTLYRREGKKGRRKARKTDASDLTPNPQKLTNIGEQLQKLNAAIDGMGPVNDLPVVARARSRKEKNKLASRACRLKKKAQHEANKIKLWGLNQEYENLLGALLRIKEVIRLKVESSDEDDPDPRGMSQRLEDILKESSGPWVAGRTKDFVQRILAVSAGGQDGAQKTPQVQATVG